ncbi:MAG TPA: hypothetical protein VF175_17750 [Lacipirellula sp.]
MKVTDIRRKLAAVLAASGMMAPAAAHAADLNTNLIVNPGFEAVDFGTLNGAGAPAVQNWANFGFTYSHDGSSGIPDYANGGPLAGGGSWYFYPGSNGGGGPRHHSKATAITQSIDLSTGATATLIPTGTATFNLSAFFSTYLTQEDYGVVQVDFLNSSNAVIGSGMVSPGQQNLQTWTQFTSSGAIPLGTTSALVSAWGANTSGNSDGYMDNLDFQVSDQLPELSITVNRSTGAITLENQTGSARNLSGYAITSDFGALKTANWLSITDNYDSGNPGPNQVDPAHAWSETSVVPATLAESDPSAAGASLANDRVVNLGNIWIQNPNEDLVFEYTSAGDTRTGIINYIAGPNNAAPAHGDLNADGAISAADWAILRTNLQTNLAGKSPAEAYRLGDLTGDLENNHADFVEFKTLYESLNGAGSFQAMLAAVPEPSSLVVCAAAGLFAAPLVRSRTSRPKTC